jgi:membrane-bound serine protease (ClpP class)
VELWVSFVLLAAGIVAIYVEIFVPAAGLIGLAGGGMIVAGVVLGYVYHDPLTGTIVLFTSLVVAPTAIALGLKAFPKTPVGRRLILGDQASAPSSSAESGVADGGNPGGTRQAELIGKGDEGDALTVLRPSGTARFGDRKLSVVTSGEYIERGARLRVTRVEGNRIVVRQVTGESG